MELLTIYMAGKYCGVSSKTMARWLDEGQINTLRTEGGHRRIRLKDLRGFMRRQGIPSPHPTPQGEGMKRILIIDDDKLIVETIVTSLEEEPFNYEVISAYDGFEAEVQVTRFNPDLLILDIMMPDVDGREVCRRIKGNPATRHIKIVVLSAYLDEENYEKMKECGAERCFSKPLPLRTLKKEVALMLGFEGCRQAVPGE